MMLVTHAIVGGAVVRLLPDRPILGLILAFTSHFVLDAIPHWDYPLRSRAFPPGTARSATAILCARIADLGLIAGDAGLGLICAWALFGSAAPALVLLGAAFAIAPDALKLIDRLFPLEPLTTLHRLHRWAHCRHQLAPATGVLSQLAFVAAVAMAGRALT